MPNKFKYETITSKAYEFLKKEFSYKYVTLRHYRSRWLPVKAYMEEHGLKLICPGVCKDFLRSVYKGRPHEELNDKEKLIEKSVSVLSEFMETGSVQKKCKVTYLDGSIGILMKDFLAYKQSRCLRKVTPDKIESHMSKFRVWLSSKCIFSIHGVNAPCVVAFIKSLAPHKRSLIHDTLMDLRGFFTFLYDSGIISANMANFIPRDNYQNQSKLPSYYTEEILSGREITPY